MSGYPVPVSPRSIGEAYCGRNRVRNGPRASNSTMLLAIEADPEAFPAAEVEKRLAAMLEAIQALFGKMELLEEGMERWEELLKKKRKDILALLAKNRKRGKAGKEAKRA